MRDENIVSVKELMRSLIVYFYNRESSILEELYNAYDSDEPDGATLTSDGKLDKIVRLLDRLKWIDEHMEYVMAFDNSEKYRIGILAQVSDEKLDFKTDSRLLDRESDLLKLQGRIKQDTGYDNFMDTIKRCSNYYDDDDATDADDTNVDDDVCANRKHTDCPCNTSEKDVVNSRYKKVEKMINILKDFGVQPDDIKRERYKDFKEILDSLENDENHE